MGKVWRGTAFGGTRGRTDVPRIVAWYIKGKINIDDLITHTMPFDEISQRYVPTVPADEDALTRAIIALASEYGRDSYRRVTALLQAAGWQVGKDRVQRDRSVARG